MKQDNIQESLARLEPALRYLATHSEAKVKDVAKKFKLKPEEIWDWLKAHNMGRRDLPVRIIDNVKAGLTPAALSAASKARKDATPAIRRALDRGAREPVSLQPPPTPTITKPGANLEPWLAAQGLKLRDEVQSYQVEVTPATAAAWLTLNQGNRNPSKAKIRRFAAAIKAGKWVLNGETVKFSDTGRLLDGQSRLRAIIEAGAPAVLEIRGGLADAAQQAMDIGEMRKGTHMLEMMGEKYPGILSPALRWIQRWSDGTLSGNKFGTSSVLENMEIAPMLKLHNGLRASVGWCVSAGYKVSALMPPSEAAFFHYLLGLASTSKRDSFFNALATGLGLTATHPAYLLRERLTADRASSARMAARERMALQIKAWNAHFAGEKMGQLGFRATGDNREAFPVIAGVKPAKKELAAA